MDIDVVDQSIRFAYAEVIAPYFGALSGQDIIEKSPGEIVTVADRECERLLGGLLRDVIDAPVLGEEAAAADPNLLDRARSWESVWLLDPIDGTVNFAEGDPHYAIMVAYVERGRTVASWIFQPEFGRMAIALLGAGATLDGQDVVVPLPDNDPGSWSGVIKDRFLPSLTKDQVEAASGVLGERHEVSHCAGFEYPDLVAGEHSFLLYWRTLPWDHAPGVLYAQEAGCQALRPDGSHYALHGNRDGLIVAHPAVASKVTNQLLGHVKR